MSNELPITYFCIACKHSGNISRGMWLRGFYSCPKCSSLFTVAIPEHIPKSQWERYSRIILSNNVCT